MCFIDLEKAFDRVPRKVLEWAMRKKDTIVIVIVIVIVIIIIIIFGFMFILYACMRWTVFRKLTSKLTYL